MFYLKKLRENKYLTYPPLSIGLFNNVFCTIKYKPLYGVDID